MASGKVPYLSITAAIDVIPAPGGVGTVLA
jgi:hypothetical protein